MQILTGEAFEMLQTLPDESVNCCVTSPPYYGLRDYGIDGQLGLEASPQEYVERLVNIFRQVWRVLRSDGTLWLNLGDSYNGSGKAGNNPEYQKRHTEFGKPFTEKSRFGKPVRIKTLKPKDLLGIPWRVAFALQDDGWYLRQDIIWHKPNPMPESVKDRCTKSHEYIFLLSKSARYFYDADAIREKAQERPQPCPEDKVKRRHGTSWHDNAYACGPSGYGHHPLGRNKRDVWTIATNPYSAAHFATFPPELPRTCIQAGCPEGGTVLDPFHGAGTTGLVAARLHRKYIGIELNPEYVELSRNRIYDDAPLFNRDVLENKS